MGDGVDDVEKELLFSARAAERIVELIEAGGRPGDQTPEGHELTTIFGALEAGAPAELQRTVERLAADGTPPGFQRTVALIRWMRLVERAVDAQRPIRRKFAERVPKDPAVAALAQAEHDYRRGMLMRQGHHGFAVQRFEQSHEGGHPEAANDLGSFYDTLGHSGEALRWWNVAADLGNAGAAGNLARYYEDHDREVAERWWTLAEQRGVPDAASRLRALRAEQVEEGAALSAPTRPAAKRWWRFGR
ncbi:hypothetical protein L3i22_083090 [Actinoplanes sp. L3-i22]|nr:hypothetical protein L3i22_083090 [Actinoplanes sp. L3-i22]